MAGTNIVKDIKMTKMTLGVYLIPFPSQDLEFNQIKVVSN